MSNLTLPDVIAGSTLDIKFTFRWFSLLVTPATADFSLLAQKEDNPSEWIELINGDIPLAAKMKFSIHGSNLDLVPNTTLNRILRIDLTDSTSSPYISLISFVIQPVPTVV